MTRGLGLPAAQTLADDPDLSLLRSMQAQLYVELPKKGAVLHKDGCWEEASWDVQPSCYTTQLWKISVHRKLNEENDNLNPMFVKQYVA